jgi:hypothetical protein
MSEFVTSADPSRFYAWVNEIAIRNEVVFFQSDVKHFGWDAAEGRRDYRANVKHGYTAAFLEKVNAREADLFPQKRTKFCKGCETRKPHSEFHVRTLRGKRTLQSNCKECRKERAARRWVQEKDYLTEQKRAYQRTLKSEPSDRE